VWLPNPIGEPEIPKLSSLNSFWLKKPPKGMNNGYLINRHLKIYFIKAMKTSDQNCQNQNFLNSAK
jgi:hypothetical protein